jgi:hypothetical protein
MSSFTSNPFALLDDNESPQKAPQQQQRAASPSKKPSAAGAGAAAEKPANKAARPPRNEYPRRGGFRGSAGNAEGLYFCTVIIGSNSLRYFF